MNTKYVLVLFLLGLFVSCVPHRKFEDLQKEADTTSSQLRECKQELADSKTGSGNRLDEIKDLRKQVKELQNDTTIRGERYRSIQRLNREMERLCEQIRKQNELLVSSSTSDKKAITEELSVTQSELNKREQELIRKEKELMLMNADLKAQELSNSQLQANLQQSQVDLQQREGVANQLQGEIQIREAKVKKLEQDLASRENRVNELERAISAQKQQATDLRNKLNTALLSYNSSELSVEQRDGKVYVSLSQDLLFATGSKTIDGKGKSALRSLAGVLNKNPDTEITIEGHTDDVGEAKSNWNLSVLRATSVVNELTTNGVNPTRIVASGRGEHHPVSQNTTTVGKAQNRRTEIILSPKLDRLYQIINY